MVGEFLAPRGRIGECGEEQQAGSRSRAGGAAARNGERGRAHLSCARSRATAGAFPSAAAAADGRRRRRRRAAAGRAAAVGRRWARRLCRTAVRTSVLITTASRSAERARACLFDGASSFLLLPLMIRPSSSSGSPRPPGTERADRARPAPQGCSVLLVPERVVAARERAAGGSLSKRTMVRAGGRGCGSALEVGCQSAATRGVRYGRSMGDRMGEGERKAREGGI